MGSVRMYVPLTIATPRTIATAVRLARSLRPSSPLSATPINARPSVSLQRAHHLEHLRCAGGAELLDDLAVGDEEGAIGDRRRARVVRDHHDRLPVGPRGEAQPVED